MNINSLIVSFIFFGMIIGLHKLFGKASILAIPLMLLFGLIGFICLMVGLFSSNFTNVEQDNKKE